MSEPFDRETKAPAMGAPMKPSPMSGYVDTPTTVSPFLPILIIGLVLLGWFGFQATQLRAERDAIIVAVANQEKPLGESKKLRDSFYALAHGAEVLADGGNPNARLIVDGLKKRGITITPNPAPTGPNALTIPATK